MRAWETFDSATMLAVVLALVVIVSIARLFLQHRRSARARHARSWRLPVLVLAQPVVAALLYLALLPPTKPGEAGTLIVPTAGATSAEIGAGQGGDAVVALPEAPHLAGIERAPDLATALRRHPGMQRVRIVGEGLEARDRDAVRGMAVDFKAPPLPRGVVELEAPTQATAGAAFLVNGRANDLRGGVAQLLDPSGARVDQMALKDDGRFALGGTTRVAGDASFTLRLRDAQRKVVEDVAIPLQVDAPPVPRVLLLAGAPGPEVKYLRRWARDAGLAMQTQMAAGGGIELGDAPLALNAATLKQFDAVILDERAWSSLGAAQRAELTEAVRNGLGLLIRVTAALSDGERQRLRALGFDVGDGRDATQVRLSQARHDDDALRARIGPGTRDEARRDTDAVPDAPELTQRALRIVAPDAVPLLRGDANAPLAVWRAEGRGRIALWTLADTYRLVLAGRDDLHAEAWSTALTTIARPRAGDAVAIEGEQRVGERIALCGLAREAQVESPQGSAVPLLIDPATGVRACAAYWPRESGWHRVRSAGDTQRFYVRAQSEATTLHANARREGTLSLVSDAPHAIASAEAAPRTPGPRWPWWLAWLLASGALWWFERSRLGVVRSSEG